MSTVDQDTLAGRIQFHQWCRPPLDAGHYRVSATQEVAALEAVGKDAFSNSMDFIVEAPRFGLTPGDVYAVYPPKGYSGAFAETLPHIVLGRRTLPWEATLDGGARTDSDRHPWMALLVVSGADMAGKPLPAVVTRPLSQLLSPEDGVVGPRLSDTAHLDPESLCSTVDLEGTLLRRIAPTRADLAYLAHVRSVGTASKETAAFLTDGWFSVVVANRLPRAPLPDGDPEHHALLVSLAGMGGCLKPDRDHEPEQSPQCMRLAVLAHWSFRCTERGGIRAAMHRLRPRSLAIPPPAEAPPAVDPGVSEAEAQVRKAWRSGFTALRHQMRLGDCTASWYRGPLTPVAHTLQAGRDLAFRSAADAALRYSPEHGMLDVSYAAAYQLGRLLALQDRHFALELRAFRQRVRRQINDLTGRRRVAAILNTGDRADSETRLMREILLSIGGIQDQPDQRPRLQADWIPRGHWSPAGVDGETGGLDLTIPEPVERWLAQLVLLYRVPFRYLVPDPRMLPPDSLCAFHVDPSWLKCLLEGACSLARLEAGDSQLDVHLRRRFLDRAMAKSVEVRRRPASEGSNASPGPLDTTGEVGPSMQRLHWPLTGYLLRSPLVEGWHGLEVHGRDAGGQPLGALRIDRLAPDVMLCIFNGQLDAMEIRQPPEALHFGATMERDATTGCEGFELKRLRRVRRPRPGIGIELTDPIPVPFRDATDRTVDIATLAADLAAKLARRRQIRSRSAFTSAEFGLQMVDTPVRLCLRRDPGGGR